MRKCGHDIAGRYFDGISFALWLQGRCIGSPARHEANLTDKRAFERAPSQLPHNSSLRAFQTLFPALVPTCHLCRVSVCTHWRTVCHLYMYLYPATFLCIILYVLYLPVRTPVDLLYAISI